MLMIAAALAEELETALSLCSDCTKVRGTGITYWSGRRGETCLCMLKLGIGPERAAKRMKTALAEVKPSQILNIGYAGALDPTLKLGDLVIVRDAVMLKQDACGKDPSSVEESGSWTLAGAEALAKTAEAAGLGVRVGDTLTSACIIGAPEHKHILFERFRATIVDMETAALGRVAAESGMPLSCVRAVSDEAGDDLFAFLPYDTDTGTVQRIVGAIAAGDWLRRYSKWREHSQAARASLSRFLEAYLERGVRP